MDEKTKALNISTRGVYFLSGREMSVGEALEVRLAMPRRLTGTSNATRTFIARVSHVERRGMPEGRSGVGVQLLYYERDLLTHTVVPSLRIEGTAILLGRWTVRCLPPTETLFPC